MNMIFKLAFFGIFLNLSIGLLAIAVPGLDYVVTQNQSGEIVQWQIANHRY